jgi:light-regulated signal transduction histidine kinase (bacteriophytochrome)
MALTHMIPPEELDVENKDLLLKTKIVVNDLQTTVADVGNIIRARVIPVKSQLVSFDASIAECLANHETQIISCHARITQSIMVTEVLFSKTYLTMIIDQLMANALRYHCPDRYLDLRISTYTQEERVILEVTDNGVGSDLLKNGSKIFGLYSTFHYYAGARGVGLYLIKAQLESLGATIVVSSTPIEERPLRYVSKYEDKLLIFLRSVHIKI